MRFNITTVLLSIMLGLFIQVSTIKHDKIDCKITRITMSEPGGGWLPPPPSNQM